MPLNQIEIRTEEINEILGKSPNGVIRWGITVFLMVIVLLLVGSWFFKYPDFVNSSIEITTETPPAEIVAKASGKIENLFVKDKDQVQENDYLAIIENPANTDHVKELIRFIDSIKNNNSGLSYQEIKFFLSSNELVLGETQAGLSAFTSAVNQFHNFIQLNYHEQKISELNKQVEGQRSYKKMLTAQMHTLEKDLELMEKEYQRYQSLFSDQTIAESELEKVKRNYLQKKYSVEGAATNLVSVDNQITTLLSNIVELQLQKQQQETQLENNFQESLNNLLNLLKTWELRYVLKAPIRGTCTFTSFWKTNQNVVAGDKVLTIIPEASQNIIGKLLLPVRGSGKVKIGQKVNIKLLNYPYMEYGMLQGLIRNISLVPTENFYSVEIEFPDGMVTNYGKTLSFHQKMQGTAEIITEDIRLIERILMPIKSLIKNRSFKD